MTSIASAVNSEKWGKETEKQLGAGDDDTWRKDMYVDTIPWEYGRFREVLEKYSKIPPSEVEAEIFKIRGKAWEVVKYPCVGSFTYLRLLEFGDDKPEMQKTIERLKAPGSQDTFLEIGGFIYQTIRRLAFEGVDSSRLYGTDLHAEFLELGYEQFRDHETLKATFVAGDMLLPEEEYAISSLAGTLDGKISIIHASNFFHLFSWESQLVICERIVRFFRRGSNAESPAVLFGVHIGSDKPGEVEHFRIFLHDETTFQSLWTEVGKRTGTSWKVSVEFPVLPRPKPNVFGKDARVARYVVKSQIL
ncbi:hypothetical protein F4813DRAFT_341790 [Daldinia decipiens]|uniref:uncharacterized protein n=1 Tax=Daldinia decipiens TaxID=326647 RepID=UPI0020C367F2|nr:uncharacterized protein F4813DRAFT_341790 [Daldinia decipiens]KAI1662758.1 hypothetical protein F4813DRAFT_341790 [Daldinia decipiens]